MVLKATKPITNGPHVLRAQPSKDDTIKQTNADDHSTTVNTNKRCEPGSAQQLQLSGWHLQIRSVCWHNTLARQLRTRPLNQIPNHLTYDALRASSLIHRSRLRFRWARAHKQRADTRGDELVAAESNLGKIMACRIVCSNNADTTKRSLQMTESSVTMYAMACYSSTNFGTPHFQRGVVSR